MDSDCCRTCMEPNTGGKLFISVFDHVNFEGLKSPQTIASLLGELFSIQIVIDDRLTKRVCTDCCNYLVTCLQFRRKCENTDVLLRAALKDETCSSQLEAIRAERNATAVEEQCHQALQQCIYYKVIEVMRFYCCLCNAILSSLEDLDNHVRNIHYLVIPTQAPNDLQCYTCQQQFATASEVETHKGPTVQRHFQCALCDTKTFESVDLFMQHYNEMHSINIEESELLAYLQETTAANPVTCCITCNCLQQFPDEYRLMEHIEQQHKSELTVNQSQIDSAKPYLCKFCYQSFDEPCQLKAHPNNNRNDTKERNIKTQMETLAHRERQDSFEERRPSDRTVTYCKQYGCRYCGKVFRQTRFLREHVLKLCNLSQPVMKPHQIAEEHPKAPEICQSPNQQVNISSGAMRYKCGSCGKQLRPIYPRKIHQKTHKTR